MTFNHIIRGVVVNALSLSPLDHECIHFPPLTSAPFPTQVWSSTLLCPQRRLASLSKGVTGRRSTPRLPLLEIASIQELNLSLEQKVSCCYVYSVSSRGSTTSLDAPAWREAFKLNPSRVRRTGSITPAQLHIISSHISKTTSTNSTTIVICIHKSLPLHILPSIHTLRG